VTTRMTLMAAVCALVAATAAAVGQDEATERAIQKYRDMLRADPWSNPALLDADRGEALWKSPRGPNKVSLEKCDLGKGPGVVDGAFAELPRYFADAGRVMDLETRVLWCMETLQGFKRADVVRRPHPGGGQPVKELGAIATYVASKSADMKFAAKLDQPQEREVVALGEALFFRRSGPFDFACSTCHENKGLRIRLQGLPQLASPDEARKVIGEWPAYRVSTTHVMTMQHRLYDCYWQMRMPELELGSEASVALIAYLTSQARGGEIAAPGLKR
jgi:sulfur-oxidizing protein SoxA